ncbi:DNA-binding IscR family transcriptional regulator [Paenibacillus turicensis]|uniref:DNA-binding IscR family transcriptional regulator n=1 Tax=Paenibacillus turicensis TaxID=160487 RepID=A0ABS4FNH8_9BACL|nr:Rrf2 family transcriptional regulator [Paenibacillus turicensis]MBP1903929.1 DNA-binding IscR family transcriptional regulator [Paenibacillus turicensis]
MTISSRFAVAIHILTLLEFNKDGISTSEYLSSSVNTNPVVIRRIIGMLNKAGLVDVKPGVAGSKLAKPLQEINLLDIYRAVQVVNQDALFAVHDSPNPDCNVGKNIQSSIEPIFTMAQRAMEDQLKHVTLKQIVDDIADKSAQFDET